MLLSPQTFCMSSPAAHTNPLLSARIRSAREAVGLTQRELADRLGVSPRTISHWETGMAPRPGPKLRRVRAFINFVEGHDDGTELTKELAGVEA